MDLSSYLHEAIFEEKDKYTYLYELIWDNFEEDGFAVTDEEGHEVDAVFKAIAIKNLINEFVYRMYDEANETDFQEIITNLANLGIGDEAAIDYCYENPEIDTEIVADKLLELFSADDLFNYFFAATYDFQQDFTFAFEDVDEFQAFVDSNTDRLDEYKEEYPSVLNWIESGMIV